MSVSESLHSNKDQMSVAIGDWFRIEQVNHAFDLDINATVVDFKVKEPMADGLLLPDIWVVFRELDSKYNHEYRLAIVLAGGSDGPVITSIITKISAESEQ